MTYEYFSPGRVNLIGEHIDYNGGHVFPCALSLGIHAVVTPRRDKIFTLASAGYSCGNVAALSLSEIEAGPRRQWTDYVTGVIHVLRKRGFDIPFGFDLRLDSSLPSGSGLSSSAALEMLSAVIARDLYGLEHLSDPELAQIAREAENTFCGVNCGIMDPFIIAVGKKDYAILLDTASLEYRQVPLQLDRVSLIIANTNKKRALNSSAYNTRRAECEKALAVLQKALADTPASYGLPATVDALCAVTPELWDKLYPDVKDPVLRKRVKHAVYEEYRTKLAVDALERGNLREFGHLMTNSHLSLRDDYQVTGPELDILAAAAWQEPGCLGARMTGAGFGGCTVSLVENDAVEDFCAHVGEKYTAATGLTAAFYPAETHDGAGRV